MDSQFLNYLKTVDPKKLQSGNNIFGADNSNPIKQLNYQGKNYWLAPDKSMSVGPGGHVKLSDDLWNSGFDATNTRALQQTAVRRAMAERNTAGLTQPGTQEDPWANYKVFEQDPFASGQYEIVPGQGGGQLLKALAHFAPIAAAVLAPPLLAGLGGGATATGAASTGTGTTSAGAAGAASSGAGAATGSGLTAADLAATTAGVGGGGAALGGGAGGAGGFTGGTLAGSGGTGFGLSTTAGGVTGLTPGMGGLGLTAPASGGGVLASTGVGSLGGIGGILNSIGKALGGLSGSQVLQGGLGLGDLAMRLWQQNELGNIANESASRSDPMNQPQRFPYQQLAGQYATGGQNIMTQPMVKAAYDLGMNDVMAKTAKFSDSGQAFKAIADNSNKVFQSTALPYLDWLGTMGGFKQGPGYAGNLYGQYASQATGAPFLGINSLVSGFNANNNANTGVTDLFKKFFDDYQKASRTPSWNSTLYTQA